MIGKRKGSMVFAKGKDKDEIVTKLKNFYNKHNGDFFNGSDKMEVEFYVVSEEKLSQNSIDLSNRKPFATKMVKRNE